ncbi:MAG: hypothetical protein CMN17_06730 [Roseovarius sp.]|nr:hypothetical protein [Roseovarius sp.]
MTCLRALTALGLSLFLALTSVTLAVARGAPLPVAEVVLCTGEGTKSVQLDARGTPIPPPHVCPDCLLAFHATAPRDPLPALRPAATTAHHPFAVARHVSALSPPPLRARAPPHPV